MKTLPTGYWTFFCTPKRWNIEKFLASPEKTTRYKIQKNQEKYFRPQQYGIVSVLNDDRKNTPPWNYSKLKLKRGIYAIVEVLSSKPEFGKSTNDKFSYPDENDSNCYSVELLFHKELLPSPLLTEYLLSDDLIRNHALLLKGKQGISSSVLQKDAFDKILELGNIAKKL